MRFLKKYSIMSLRAHRAWQSPEIASSSHKVGFLAMIFSGFSLSNNNKGIALLIVIAISGVVSLIIGVMMSQYIIHTHSIRSSIDKVQAFYTAEAGIKKAIYYLTEDETKGIDYRTGDLIADMPIQEEVFYEKDDQAEISIIDDCGLVRIKSRAKGRFPKTIEVVVTGVVPEDLRSNLHMVSSKPLVLATGGKLKGLIKLNQDPVYQGGSIDGVLETNASLPYPGIFNLTFTNAISYFRYLLSSPNEFGAELFSSQVFSPDKPFPTNKVFVNDMILI
jgi:hypothetical protein